MPFASLPDLYRGRLHASVTERILALLPAIAYLGVIFLVSHQPGDSISSPIDDRLAHFAEYFLLGLLLLFAATAFADSIPRRLHFAASWLFAILWAAGDEFHQSFVPGRDSSPSDLLFDVLGVTTSLALLAAMLHRREMAR